MNSNERELRPGEEEALQGLLRAMSPEAEPPAETRERIRRAVAAEWRAAVRPTAIGGARSGTAPRTTQTWRRLVMAVAASIAVVAVTVGVIQTRAPTAGDVVATLSRVVGPVQGARGNAGWQAVAEGQSLAAGQHLVTGPRSRAALSLAGGVTLRLDADTRVLLAAIDRVVVDRGTVYLDGGDQPVTGPGVGIDTAFGTTRHVGTQYEVRVLPAKMRVSVREGLVETTPDTGRPIVAQAGEELVIGTGGSVARGTVDRRDARWDWIADVTPPFAIEGRRLTEFLAWVCRETGRDLTFATPEAEAAASAVVLRGSVTGLSPDEALVAVMATTTLSFSDDNGRLVVETAVRQAAAR